MAPMFISPYQEELFESALRSLGIFKQSDYCSCRSHLFPQRRHVTSHPKTQWLKTVSIYLAQEATGWGFHWA